MQPCQWWPHITVWQIHGASLEIVCSGALAVAAQVNNGCSQPTCCCQHPRKSMSTQWNEGSISVHPWCHSSSSSPVLWPKDLHCWQDSWGFIWFGKNLLSSKAEVIIFLFWSKLESESWAWNRAIQIPSSDPCPPAHSLQWEKKQLEGPLSPTKTQSQKIKRNGWILD